jgi:hypothetical protein
LKGSAPKIYTQDEAIATVNMVLIEQSASLASVMQQSDQAYPSGETSPNTSEGPDSNGNGEAKDTVNRK